MCKRTVMHEMSIALEIIEIAERHAREAGASRVREVEIEVGSLSGVEYNALVFALDSAVKNTLLEKASLKLNRISAEAHCQDCETDFQPSGPLDNCPACGSYFYHISKGKELRVKSLLVD